MEKLIHEYDWVWLAAPQLSFTIRLIMTTQWKIIRGEYKLKASTIMINPEITAHSDVCEIDEEGCLSLPGIFGQVERWRQIIVAYTTLTGQSENRQLAGLDAIIVQHEIDHLNGVLFIDKAKDIRYE